MVGEHEVVNEDQQPTNDDDTTIRTGTLWTTVAHIITAVIGSGVLSLAWSTAQFGWIGGPIALISFAFVTYISSILLSDCYRSPDPVTGTTNRSFTNAVRVILVRSGNQIAIITKDEMPNVNTMPTFVSKMSFCYASIGLGLGFAQDTIKSPPENKVTKRASAIAVTVTSIFYLGCGYLGYAAFGNNAPGNLLTGFGFYEPYWIVDFANVCIIIHLIGGYQ
nr:hypothetical protein [Tanacetum cinerariifolium]